MVVVAEFCYLLGYTEDVSDKVAVKELLEQFKRKIIVSYSNYGVSVIEKYFPNNHKKYSRYAIKKEPDVFQRDKLKSFIEAVEPKFHIEKIDESNYNKVLEDEFMADCCSNLESVALAEKLRYHFEKEYEAYSIY